MASLFTKIIQREIPCHLVAEDDDYIAFLDINPVAKGHCLVVPKKEVDYIFDLDADTLAGLNLFAKKVGLAIEKEVPCMRIGLAVVGLEVPHCHMHLIPLNSMKDMDFGQPKLKMSNDEFAALATAIQKHI